VAGLTPQGWEDAAFAAFAAFWAAETPIAYPNVPFNPETEVGDDPAAAWVRLVVQVGSQAPIGTSGFRFREGVLGIEIHARAEQSRARLDEVADLALRFFEEANVEATTFQEVVGPEEIGSDGAWYQCNVRAGFRYLTHRGAP
jgi:hypothetical protein